MATDVIMPVLGMAQDSGTLVRWLKQPGQSVTRGEILFEVETDKAVQEIEAQADGVLGPWLAGEGAVVPVTQVVARLYAPGEAPVAAETPAPAVAAPKPPLVTASPLATRMAAAHNINLAQVRTDDGKIHKADVMAYLAAAEQAPAGKMLASPKARRLAAERNLALTAIQGSGPDGAVLAADVLTWQSPAAVVQAVAPVAGVSPVIAKEVDDQSALPMSTAWRIMAERTTQAWTSAPHFVLQRRVLAGRLLDWQRGAQSRLAQKITVSDILVMACGRALARHPQICRSWQDGRPVAASAIHIGLAVALDDGLVVPVIRNADQLSLGDIATSRADLVARAKARRLHSDDLAGGVFTISNLGMFGVDRFLAILNAPQAGILAVGRIQDQVLPIDGQVSIQPVIELSVTFDHRVVDGARGAHFLQTLAALIEEPLQLLEQSSVSAQMQMLVR
jgi:pyruvate dehydrogenase E2 component (dihydrolipoamide acetyltransferase)